MSDLLLAKRHLSQDPTLKPLIKDYHLKDYWGGHPNHFLDLVDIVTGQQLSMKAAATIYRRFLALFDTPTPSAQQILNTSHEDLRSVGLSNSKAGYIKNIAAAIKEGSLDLETLPSLSDVQVTQQLTALKGLGPWSAEMFLMFSLRRPDVFSLGDLGVRTAISRLYHIDREDKQKILKLSERWRPYRTYACRYLWASLENV